MPVNIEEKPESHLIVAHFTGKLTREDYARFVPIADRFIEANRPVRMLVDMAGFEGWDLGSAWEDLKFGVKHYSDMARLAIVGDKRWERWMAVLWKPFTKAQLKAFTLEQRSEAENWVLAG